MKRNAGIKRNAGVKLFAAIAAAAFFLLCAGQAREACAAERPNYYGYVMTKEDLDTENGWTEAGSAEAVEQQLRAGGYRKVRLTKKIKKNIGESEYAPYDINGTLILDLNGNELSFRLDHAETHVDDYEPKNYILFRVQSGANVVIMDSSAKKKGRILYHAYMYDISDHSHKYYVRDMFEILDGGKVVLNSGNIICGRSKQVWLTLPNEIVSRAVPSPVWSGNVRVSINGTPFRVLSGGALTVNGGHVEGRGYSVMHSVFFSYNDVFDDFRRASAIRAEEGAHVYLNGGSFCGQAGANAISGIGAVEVRGGKFSCRKVDREWIPTPRNASGLYCREGQEGLTGVTSASISRGRLNSDNEVEFPSEIESSDIRVYMEGGSPNSGTWSPASDGDREIAVDCEPYYPDMGPKQGINYKWYLSESGKRVTPKYTTYGVAGGHISLDKLTAPAREKSASAGITLVGSSGSAKLSDPEKAVAFGGVQGGHAYEVNCDIYDTGHYGDSFSVKFRAQPYTLYVQPFKEALEGTVTWAEQPGYEKETKLNVSVNAPEDTLTYTYQFFKDGKWDEVQGSSPKQSSIYIGGALAEYAGCPVKAVVSSTAYAGSVVSNTATVQRLPAKQGVVRAVVESNASDPSRAVIKNYRSDQWYRVFDHVAANDSGLGGQAGSVSGADISGLTKGKYYYLYTSFDNSGGTHFASPTYCTEFYAGETAELRGIYIKDHGSSALRGENRTIYVPVGGTVTLPASEVPGNANDPSESGNYRISQSQGSSMNQGNPAYMISVNGSGLYEAGNGYSQAGEIESISLTGKWAGRSGLYAVMKDRGSWSRVIGNWEVVVYDPGSLALTDAAADVTGLADLTIGAGDSYTPEPQVSFLQPEAANKYQLRWSVETGTSTGFMRTNETDAVTIDPVSGRVTAKAPGSAHIALSLTDGSSYSDLASYMLTVAAADGAVTGDGSGSGTEWAHVHTYGAPITENATCTEDGRIYTVCSGCGAEMLIQTLPATGHVPGAMEHDGIQHWRSCIYCGIALDAEGHVFDENGVCTVCGYIESSHDEDSDDMSGTYPSDDASGDTGSGAGGAEADGGSAESGKSEEEKAGQSAPEEETVKEGWFEQEDGWHYGRDGAELTGWEKIDGSWYWFDDDGVMATEWTEIEGEWYYLGTSGSMLAGWQKIGGAWYYFGDGAMRTDWQKIDGQWYWFDVDGVMATGWKEIDECWYWFSENGVMAADCWIDDCYLGSDGKMLTNAYTPDGYYVGADGKWVP